MSTVQQLLNVLKKTFYDLTPVSNKQMSLMSMANGGIGFVNTKPITQFCTAGINHGTLGSRGYFFLIDTDGWRRSCINEEKIFFPR